MEMERGKTEIFSYGFNFPLSQIEPTACLTITASFTIGLLCRIMLTLIP